MERSLYIAVDLGAGSGRVFLAGIEPREMLLEEIRRFHYPPIQAGGHLRWDLSRIFDEVKTGLRDAGRRARQLGRHIVSIGVDSWGVDYGLIGTRGELLEDPICYRDQRTAGAVEQVASLIAPAEIYARTGIQLLDFNTIYQLYSHKKTGIPANADRLLLIPDLIDYLLAGVAVTEFTNATTTQLVNAESCKWDTELLEVLQLPRRLFTDIVQAGTRLGPLTPEMAAEVELEGVNVVATATHDTASAVAGTPLQEGWAYISSGTWSLVGVERDNHLINSETASRNFTNEGGAFGSVRFLKNVCGLWLLESCRKEWKERGQGVDYDTLIAQVASLESTPALIYPDDPRFFNPQSMIDAVSEQLDRTGQELSMEQPAVARTILDSLALRYSAVVRDIESVTGKKVIGVHIVGGGSRNDYLNQATASATGLPVVAGPDEATIIGNVLVQGIAAGRFGSIAEARRHVSSNLALKRFLPTSTEAWEAAARRYAAVEVRFIS
jgi:rhamnulokinase